MTASTGAAVAITNDGLWHQLPIENGGTIVNTGSVALNISPTDPAQGAPISISPNGAIPWAGGGTVYAQVQSLVQPGSAYIVYGVQTYSTGNQGLGANGLSNVAGITGAPAGITIASGATQDFPYTGFNLRTAFNLWSWTFASTGADPTEGNVTIQLITSLVGALADSVTDRIKAPWNCSSDVLAGLYVPAPTSITPVTFAVSNFTDVTIEFNMNYSPA